MEKEIAIDIRNVSKCYRRYFHPADRLKELIFPHKPRGEEFWALRDISFQIQKGESLGILGQNGSGKSTLLQIITNTLTPTTGSVEAHGKISALLELGSGFNPDFTGRQNVMVNGRILGFSQQEVEAKLDEIIEFAEIGDFVDQPVHTYSSGMFVRLAFAAAVVWEPEILIVDEALAVGDIFFQQKCFSRIKTLHKKGVTLLFVSHDTRSVLNLCSRAVVLDHGRLLYLGETTRAVEKYRENYYNQFELANKTPKQSVNLSVQSKVMDPALSEVRQYSASQSPALDTFITDFPENGHYGQLLGLIKGISLIDAHGQTKANFLHNDELTLSVRLGEHPPDIVPLNVGFQLRDKLGQIIIGTNTKMLGQDLLKETSGEGFICQFRFRLSISPGEYSLSVAVAENEDHVQTIYDYINNVTVISIIADGRSNEQGGVCWPDITVSSLVNLEH